MSKNIIISLTAQKRLLKDICDIIRKPLTTDGIYYVHDEENILKGYALLIGPSDTCYQDGMYLFSFNFPSDYPYCPPVVKFHTHDGVTRFHPNLYRNGKVCLSLLNTWKGEQWTSTQTIRSILLTLISLFNNNPLINEPGFSKHNICCEPYRRSIEFMNYKTAILNILTQKSLPAKFFGFFPVIKTIIEERRQDIMNRINRLVENKGKPTSLYVKVYNMTTILKYKQLKQDLHLVLSNLYEN